MGASLSLGVLIFPTIGIFALAITASATLLLSKRRESQSGLTGLVSGLSLPLFYVAYLNRDGPGMVCKKFADGSESCGEMWSPWPWVAVGVFLLLAGLTSFLVTKRRLARISLD